MLHASDRPLVDCYDLLMFDLDGVVYVGDDAVPGAPEHLARVREAGVHVAFVTNNASRAPSAVAEKLTGAGGRRPTAADVVTSAQAAAHVLLERFGAGAAVVVLGADGLARRAARGGAAPGRGRRRRRRRGHRLRPRRRVARGDAGRDPDPGRAARGSRATPTSPCPSRAAARRRDTASLVRLLADFSRRRRRRSPASRRRRCWRRRSAGSAAPGR